MKVVQVIATIGDDFGGPSHGAVALNEELRRRGVDAVLLTTSLGYDSATAERVTGSVDSVVQIHAASRPAALMNSWSIWKGLKRELQDASFVHLHGQYLLPHVYAFYFCSRYSKPFGVQLHGGLEQYHRSRSRLKKSVYNVLVGRRILRRADYLMFASELEAHNAKTSINFRQGIVAQLGVTEYMPVRSSDIEGRLGGSPRMRCVLFLGRLTTKKRPNLLLECWNDVVAQFPDAKLIIAGPDGDYSASRLRRLAQELGVNSSVVILGPVAAGTKAWLYERCGVFVQPSENENFGITVPEAMLYGCFVIASQAVASAEFLHESSSGEVLDDVTSNSLSEAIIRAIHSPETPSSSSRGRVFAKERLTWAPAAVALIEQWRHREI